jgi:hypothetical protein
MIPTELLGFHIPTFLRQCADLWALPHELVVQEIALPFVGLYFTVCTVSLLSFQIMILIHG